MANNFKIIVRNLIQDSFLYDYSVRFRRKTVYKKWLSHSKIGIMPGYAKELLIREFALKFDIKVFVETGTFLGETVFAIKNVFARILSIELSQQLAQSAKRRFHRYPNISIIQGDSSQKLAEVLAQINSKTLFWLDGHYSGSITAKGHGNTPILAELALILRHSLPNHVILIDDARCFNGTDGYPCLQQIEILAKQSGQYNTMELHDDVIAIYQHSESKV